MSLLNRTPVLISSIKVYTEKVCLSRNIPSISQSLFMRHNTCFGCLGRSARITDVTRSPSPPLPSSHPIPSSLEPSISLPLSNRAAADTLAPSWLDRPRSARRSSCSLFYFDIFGYDRVLRVQGWVNSSNSGIVNDKS